MNKQVVLLVLDGWGYREDKKDNAIEASKKPNFDDLWENSPHTTLSASGLAVGLPEGQMGNSEVGHTTIGAGKVVYQDLVRIDNAIQDSSFDNNESFSKLFNHIKENNSVLHILGLLSPGGVHSHMDHLFAFLKLAKKNNIFKIAIHIFTDGRDVPPKSACSYIKELENMLHDLGVGKISTLSGRYYAMDRDHNWERVDKVLDAMFLGKGIIVKDQTSSFVDNSCGDYISDEYLEPIVFENENNEKLSIKNNDGVFFFNFRADRARMLTSKILEKREELNLKLLTMTKYSDDFDCDVVFPPIKIETTLAKELSLNHKTQSHIAETEKYAHATYFLDGGVESPYEGEEYILVPSRKDVKTHDMAPEMKVHEITNKVLEKLDEGKDFIFVNFANADMVGHTANVPAIVASVEAVDRELGRIKEKVKERNAVFLITADHGNAELNIDPKTGERHTSHTSNKVPFIMFDNSGVLREEGTLADVTPTIFDIMDINKPEGMMGESLIK